MCQIIVAQRSSGINRFQYKYGEHVLEETFNKNKSKVLISRKICTSTTLEIWSYAIKSNKTFILLAIYFILLHMKTHRKAAYCLCRFTIAHVRPTVTHNFLYVVCSSNLTTKYLILGKLPGTHDLSISFSENSQERTTQLSHSRETSKNARSKYLILGKLPGTHDQTCTNYVLLSYTRQQDKPNQLLLILPIHNLN